MRAGAVLGRQVSQGQGEAARTEAIHATLSLGGGSPGTGLMVCGEEASVSPSLEGVERTVP